MTCKPCPTRANGLQHHTEATSPVWTAIAISMGLVIGTSPGTALAGGMTVMPKADVAVVQVERTTPVTITTDPVATRVSKTNLSLLPSVTATSLDISASKTGIARIGSDALYQGVVAVAPVPGGAITSGQTPDGDPQFLVDFDGDGLTRYEVAASSGVTLSTTDTIGQQGGFAAISDSTAGNVRTAVVSIGTRSEGSSLRSTDGLIEIAGAQTPQLIAKAGERRRNEQDFSYTPAIEYDLNGYWKGGLLKVIFAAKPRIVDDWYSDRGNDELWGLR